LKSDSIWPSMDGVRQPCQSAFSCSARARDRQVTSRRHR